jgi:aspartate/methionine/tyrosine aminotransferase
MLYEKNPSLAGTEVSNPVVTVALTHGLSMCGYLFLDEGDTLISPELYWGNYRLVFQSGYGAKIATYNTFKDGGFDVAALRESLLTGEPGKRVVLLNFPNNPTGYTPTPAEVDGIVAALTEAADAGNDVVALIDDAYFGLVYEDGIFTESIFTRLANAHEGILAVKIDGATKEDYAWGFRVGFLTYGIKNATPALYKAMEAKTAGAVRGNVSNGPHLSQSLMLAAYNDADYGTQKQEKYDLLKARYDKVIDILASNPQYAEAFEPLPFNSGYFMCLTLKDKDPETIRQILLDEYSTGVIAAAGVLRLAFSAAPLDCLEELFANIYAACSQ